MRKILNYFNKAKDYRIERKIKIPKYLSCLLKFEFLRNGFFKQYEDKIINSIYFDDNLSSFFKSNLDGDLLRVKPRIRWYDENISLANHEFKIKRGFIGTKIVNKKITIILIAMYLFIFFTMITGAFIGSPDWIRGKRLDMQVHLFPFLLIIWFLTPWMLRTSDKFEKFFKILDEKTR